MPQHAMKLVTIICEALARDALCALFREVGARGFTAFQVEGVGSKGDRTAEMLELANLQFEVVVPPDVATALLERLERDYFPNYAMIAYESDVRVRRPAKF